MSPGDASAHLSKGEVVSGRSASVDAGPQDRGLFDIIGANDTHPDRAEGLSVCVQFDAPDLNGWSRIEDGSMSIGLGDADQADAVVAGTIADLFVNAGNPLNFLTDGDPAALKDFMHAFALQHRSGHLLVW